MQFLWEAVFPCSSCVRQYYNVVPMVGSIPMQFLWEAVFPCSSCEALFPDNRPSFCLPARNWAMPGLTSVSYWQLQPTTWQILGKNTSGFRGFQTFVQQSRAKPGAALQTQSSLINQVSQSFGCGGRIQLQHFQMPQSSLAMLKGSVLSRDYEVILDENHLPGKKVKFFCGKYFFYLIPKGIQIAYLVQKLQQFCRMGGFCPLLELHREGSAPAACAADLFFPATVYVLLGLFGLL